MGCARIAQFVASTDGEVELSIRIQLSTSVALEGSSSRVRT